MNYFRVNLLFLSYILCILGVRSHYRRQPLVSTYFGDINGTILTSRLGKRIYSFRGIRYAEPPINELRFKPPVPIEKVQGVYDATEDGPICPMPISEPTSEDCLMLNVYTTKLPRGKHNPRRPVIVFIHSGGYFYGSSASSWVGPQYFMDQDVVLVTFNYRLGALGFLSTGDKEAPGNNGLKDQVVALKWVQKNIENFGGDPNSVTLVGYSAGGWSVILHMLSPLSKGLFHKGAALSGTPLGTLAWPNNLTNYTKVQARILGCPDDTSEKIISCLRTKPAQDIANSLSQFKEFNDWSPLLIWTPVAEPDVGEPRFLTDDPVRLITKRQFQQVPFICGRVNDEFGYFTIDLLGNETLVKDLNENFEKIMPILFEYERDTNFSKEVSRSIKKFYFHDRPIDRSQEAALKSVSEDLIEFSLHRTAGLISQYSNNHVYYYKFTYQGRYSNFYIPGTNDTVPYGVVHEDDLMYLFYMPRLFPFFKEGTHKEVEMVVKLTTLYANFAKTGNPTPTRSRILDNVTWKPYVIPSERKYLDIGKQLILKEKVIDNRYQFWENLFPVSA